MEVSSIQSQDGIYEDGGTGPSTSYLGGHVDQTRSSTFLSSTLPDEDWTKVSDLAERRRIQNRIAQRNYRKKLKERIANLEKRAANTETTSGPKTQRPPHSQPDNEQDTGVHYDSPSSGYSYRAPSPPSQNETVLSVGHRWQDRSMTSDKDGLLEFSLNSFNDEPCSSISEGIRQSESGVLGDEIAQRLAGPVLPPTSSSVEQPVPVQKHSAALRCPHCSKSFTRAYNLRSHLRTHTDERPFVCAICGKAFARQHDRAQHYHLHSAVKTYVCGSDVHGDFQWGCGQNFAHAGALKQHFCSGTGKACVERFLNSADVQKHSDNSIAGFPADLVKQYPFLASADKAAPEEERNSNDARSRSDPSYYKSDDAGYGLETEASFGDTNNEALELFLHTRRGGTTDENRNVASHSYMNPSSGSRATSGTRHDGHSPRSTRDRPRSRDSIVRIPKMVSFRASVSRPPDIPLALMSPPPSPGSRIIRRQRKVRPSQGDSALIGIMDNGRHPDIASVAGQGPLPSNSEISSRPDTDSPIDESEIMADAEELEGNGIEASQNQQDREMPMEPDVDNLVKSNEDLDTSDDNMSLRSFTESVFDTSSVLSSASSSYSNSHATVASLVDILIRDPNMDRLLAMTISEFGVGSARYTRNLSRILKSYSRHLIKATNNLSLPKDQRDNYLIAAKTVSRSRYQISSLIASRYSERATTAKDFRYRQVKMTSSHLDQIDQSDNEQPSSNEESSEDEADYTTAEVKDFLVSGDPFWQLKRNIRSLVIPDEFLDYIYDSARSFLDLVLTEERIRCTVHGLRDALLGGRDIKSDLSRQIRKMAAGLKREYMNTSQLDAAINLETYSEYISALAIDRINATFTSHGANNPSLAQMQDREPNATSSHTESMGPKGRNTRTPLPHEDLLEQTVAETLPLVLYVDLVPHGKFITSSNAFVSFSDGLYDIAYPTFFSEATRFVEATIESLQGSEDGLSLEGLRLLPVLAEMKSCGLKNGNWVHFSMDTSNLRVTPLDRMKIWIEASTAAEWDWWPLRPPNCLGDQPRAEISWQCSCGATRRVSTFPSYASELQSIFNNFPLSPTGPGSSGPPDRPPSSLSNASSQGARSTQSTGSTSTSQSGNQSGRSSLSSSNTAMTAPDAGDDSVVDFGNGPRRYIYVFLLIKASEYVLEPIDVSSMTSRDFFQALRAAYMRHRSLWRRVLSVSVYNHCDFIKIIKPEPDTFMPGDLNFELPPDHDDEYSYRPRPTHSPPVTRHMFKHFFYGCYESDSLWHSVHVLLPLTPRCRIRNPAGEMLDFFPKRDRRVAGASRSEKVEVCYGIAARECRSLFRVVVYLCLIMAPAFWFVFAWLFMWGDRGDLQDATVPMTLVLAMLGVLWAVVNSGSDVRRQYGDVPS